MSLSILLLNPMHGLKLGEYSRTCDITGIECLYVLDGYNLLKRKRRDKVSKNNNKIREIYDPYLFLEEMKKSGYSTIAAALTDDASSLYGDFMYSDKNLVLFGNEEEQFPKEIISLCDKVVMIPQNGATQRNDKQMQCLTLSVALPMFIGEYMSQKERFITNS